MIILLYLNSLIVSMTLMISSHPVAIMALILIQAVNLCLVIWTYMKISWFSFILFLIFLGGLMVLFVYISSLASNEKFEMSNQEMKFTTLTVSTLMLTTMMGSFYFKGLSENNTTVSKSLKILFSDNSLLTTTTIISYLLLTLLVVVSVASMYEGPLRNLIFK